MLIHSHAYADSLRYSLFCLIIFSIFLFFLIKKTKHQTYEKFFRFNETKHQTYKKFLSEKKRTKKRGIVYRIFFMVPTGLNGEK
jgi:hypothetical protein